MKELVGQQLGHYYLRHLQGRGGFADVYQGEHIHLKSLAAIKILHSRISAELQNSFLHEARILARLSHPHIIRILDFGIDNAVPFLVMEFAPHGTIRQRYPHGSRLPLTTIVPFVLQIADGLQYAHEQKLIHRDLKPENLLISQHGELLLSDFGIALIAQTSLSTLDDPQYRFAGTASYMAPEQFQGHPCYASDQYALAIMTYEWLCGKRPFTGTFLEIFSQHQSTPPPALRTSVPDLPPAVEQVLMIALAKEPERRFASVQAFAHALTQASELSLSTSQRQPAIFTSSVPTPSLPEPFSVSIISTPSTSDSPPPYPALNSWATMPMSNPHATPPGAFPATSPVHAASALTAETASSLAPAMATGQYLHSSWSSTARPRWFLQRNFLFLIAFIVILLVGGNAAFFFASHPTHSSHPILPPTPSLPASLATPTHTGSTALAVANPRATRATPVPTSVPTVAAPQATPTPTLPPPMPTPTPTPTASSSNNTPVYTSSLSAQDNANWDIFTYAGGGGCAFSGGSYHATMPQKGSVAQCVAENSGITNFSCQVQMKIISGDGGGLIFRSDANGNFYRLRIGADGSYDLVSQRSSIITSTSTAIIQGYNKINVIKVVAIGSQISLYANGQLLTTVQDTASSSGRFGLFSVDFSQSADVAFNNIQVKTL